MAVGSRFERKCRKNRNGWEKFRETLNLSGKMTIMKIKNGGNTLDKQKHYSVYMIAEMA